MEREGGGMMRRGEEIRGRVEVAKGEEGRRKRGRREFEDEGKGE